MFSLRSIASSAAVVALSAGMTLAATSWTPSSGSTTNFNYTNGQTENGLFTDSAPDVFDDSLLFFPNNFTADNDNTTANDTLSFVLNAKPGSKIGRVSAKLNGDYSSSDDVPTTSFDEVSAIMLPFGGTTASGTLTLTNQATSAVLSQAFTFSPGSPFFGDGTFTGTAGINVPSDWVTVLVQLDTTLSTFDFPIWSKSAIALPGSTSTIQLKGATIDLQAAAVPLPGAILAAPGAIAFAWAARRKMALR